MADKRKRPTREQVEFAMKIVNTLSNVLYIVFVAIRTWSQVALIL